MRVGAWADDGPPTFGDSADWVFDVLVYPRSGQPGDSEVGEGNPPDLWARGQDPGGGSDPPSGIPHIPAGADAAGATAVLRRAELVRRATLLGLPSPSEETPLAEAEAVLELRWRDREADAIRDVRSVVEHSARNLVTAVRIGAHEGPQAVQRPLGELDRWFQRMSRWRRSADPVASDERGDLGLVLGQVHQEWAERLAARDIFVMLDDGTIPGEAMVYGDRHEAADTFLDELFANLEAHSSAGVAEVSLQITDVSVTLRVRNSVGPTPPDPDRLPGLPTGRVRVDRDGCDRGWGIGEHIIDRAVRARGGSVRFESGRPGCYEAVLNLPRYR